MLTISQSPPPWLSKQSSPDGQMLPNCLNAYFSDTDWNILNAAIGEGTETPNFAGDCGLHQVCFEQVTNSAGDSGSATFSSYTNGSATTKGSENQIGTSDGMQFTPSCGYNATNHDNLLGTLTFTNSVSDTGGTTTYSNPN